MLRSVRLVNYKGFRNYHIRFEENSVLVGANNAGKTSVISALRLVASLIPLARRVNPSITGLTRGSITRGWPVTQAALESAAFNSENVRYDFRSAETRIDAEFSSGAHLIVVWSEVPEDDTEPAPFFYLTPPRRFNGPLRSSARDHLDDIAVVPTLAPVDDHENFVTDETLRRNLTSRRTSRYFRNALFREQATDSEWATFLNFVVENTPELRSLSVSRRYGVREDELDAYYVDADGTRQREITWAGDGIQIWLQVLYHYWRQRGSSTVILDEPDVYLHPDLQRRLARLVFSGDHQTILATHSIDILAEADVGAAIWVDRNRARGERATSNRSFSQLGRRLGSSVELSLARALRSGMALFVEGQDLQLMSILAQTVDANRIARRVDFATIPLGGLSRHFLVSGFSEVLTSLGADIRSAVLLDGDLRSTASRDSLRQVIIRDGVDLHIWVRRELENYVIAPSAIARVAGISESDASALLNEVIASLREDTLHSIQAQRLLERREFGSITAGLSELSVLTAASQELADAWSSREGQLSVVDAKKLISILNSELQARGARTVSPVKLAKNLPLVDIPDEAANYFHHIEYILDEAVHSD